MASDGFVNVDAAASLPVQPQGTAGGGNVFNVGSLFGDSRGTASSNGSGAASSSAGSAASDGGAASATPSATAVPPQIAGAVSGVASFFETNKTAILVGLVVTALAALAAVLWRMLKRK